MTYHYRPAQDLCLSYRVNGPITEEIRALLLENRLDLSYREIELLAIELAPHVRELLFRFLTARLQYQEGDDPHPKACARLRSLLMRWEAGRTLLEREGIITDQNGNLLAG